MISTSPVPGAPIWLDLATPDTDATAAFYTGLFGWTAPSAGPDSGGYAFFELDGKMIGGFGPLMEPGASPAWIPYFATTDADASTKAVEQAGGTVRVPPMDVMTEGRMAQYTDPTGGKFAVWQPGNTTGFKVANVPGSLSWVELHTTDGPAAIAFYRSALGWHVQEMPMGEGMVYTVLSPGDRQGDDDGFGGVMAMPELPEVLWRPYFEVEDCDATVAKATALGAKVIMEPATMPEVGRMAELVDPHGARFSVITGASRS
ncbi:VOC family protein [Streptacidiphilus sp. EB129]|uniref:VOC family protein n=1 Tax=Streptacidiphilus sp. EB129 TaxID=3156262 RepID=UPI00351688FD